MKALISSFIIVSSVFWGGNGALAESYSIGVQDFPDYRPYSEFSENRYGGFNRELLDMFAAYGGYRFDYQALPIKRLNRDFLAGKLDFNYPDNAYWASRDKQNLVISYSDPVVRFVDGVMVRPENLGKGLEVLSSLNIMLGFTPEPFLPLIDSGQIKVSTSSDYHRLINQVVLGVYAGLYSNVVVSREQIRTRFGEDDTLVFDPGLPHVVSTRHLSSIHHPQVIEQFNRFLLEKKADIQRLKEAYRVEDLVQLR